MVNSTTQPLVEPAATTTFLGGIFSIVAHPFLVVTRVYETLLGVLDTVIYYVMNCLLLVFAFADDLMEFFTKTAHNVRLTQKFFQHQMYKNIN